MTDDHARSADAESVLQTQSAEASPAATVATSIAPPTVPGPLGDWRPQSVWPRVIGIIGIILSVFGAIQGLWSIVGALMQLFVGDVLSADPDAAEAGEVFDRMAHWAPWNIASGSLLFLVASLLFIGSIGLLMRQPWSRVLCLTWAYCKIIAALFSAVIVFFMQRDLMLAISNAQAQGGGAPPPAFIHFQKWM